MKQYYESNRNREMCMNMCDMCCCMCNNIEPSFSCIHMSAPEVEK